MMEAQDCDVSMNRSLACETMVNVKDSIYKGAESRFVKVCFDSIHD